MATPIKECLSASVAALQDARGREGGRIAELLDKRNKGITALIDDIRPLLDGVQTRYRDRLASACNGSTCRPIRNGSSRSSRCSRNAPTWPRKSIGSGSHVTEVSAILRRSEPVGRRLDFLIQELNREANTFASKVQEEPLTRVGVELKVLIEQMREQVQNLE